MTLDRPADDRLGTAPKHLEHLWVGAVDSRPNGIGAEDCDHPAPALRRGLGDARRRRVARRQARRSPRSEPLRNPRRAGSRAASGSGCPVRVPGAPGSGRGRARRPDNGGHPGRPRGPRPGGRRRTARTSAAATAAPGRACSATRRRSSAMASRPEPSPIRSSYSSSMAWSRSSSSRSASPARELFAGDVAQSGPDQWARASSSVARARPGYRRRAPREPVVDRARSARHRTRRRRQPGDSPTPWS